MLRTLLLTLSVSIFGNQAHTQTCGDADTPCEIENGSYHIAVPADVEKPGAFIFLHGSNGHGRSAVKNKGFVKRVNDRGYALLAPTGAPQGIGGGRDWGVNDGLPDDRDDVAYMRAVIDDAVERFNIDRDHIVLTGFSRGGSMVWDIACAAPDTATAYAAVAGAFWEPFVETCAAPVDLHHTHGFKDRMVPLEGRQGVWKGFNFHQGNVLKAVDIWREVNGCTGRADSSVTEDGSWRKLWSGCSAGSIALTVWPGGHGLPKGWSNTVLDWFEDNKNGS